MDNQLTSIIWSSYLGGVNDDAIYSLALDDDDNIYVTGGTNSTDFPVTANAYQNSYQDSIKADAFITKISSNGNQILSSSYFGEVFTKNNCYDYTAATSNTDISNNYEYHGTPLKTCLLYTSPSPRD